MNRISENGVGSQAKAVWSLAAIYEDAAARERAAAFCDELMRQFWARFEFALSWWSFVTLERPGAAQEAVEKAAQADLVIFSASPNGDFPLPVKVWLDAWLKQRGEREGILVGLLDAPGAPPDADAPRHRALRNAAHRGTMDYLTQVPPDLSRTIPDSLESYRSRADHITTLLDNILHQPIPPAPPLP